METMRKGKPARGGFSLVEILVVTGIAAFFLFVAAINYRGYTLKQLTRDAAKTLGSDLRFTAVHAVKVGVSRDLRVSPIPRGWKVVDPAGVVKVEQIPSAVGIGVSKLPQAPKDARLVPGASLDVFPQR